MIIKYGTTRQETKIFQQKIKYGKTQKEEREVIKCTKKRWERKTGEKNEPQIKRVQNVIKRKKK